MIRKNMTYIPNERVLFEMENIGSRSALREENLFINIWIINEFKSLQVHLGAEFTETF